MRAIEHAEKELVAGRLWRAKEILQGSIPNAGYDCDLFERLGTVLLKMGDLREAGRFLFLSGPRQLSYHEAINIFLRQHSKNPRGLYAAFPRTAKLARREDYPEPLREELKQLGFPKVLRDSRGNFTGTSEGSWFLGLAGWLLAVSILATLLLGLWKIIEIWIWIKRR